MVEVRVGDNTDNVSVVGDWTNWRAVKECFVTTSPVLRSRSEGSGVDGFVPLTGETWVLYELQDSDTT